MMRKIKQYMSEAVVWFLLKYYHPKCHRSIDTLPIYYWQKIHENGNLSYLMISKTIHIEVKEPRFIQKYLLSIVWRKMYDEMISRFGFSEEFLEVFRKEKEITIMKANMIIKNDMTKKTFIEIAEIELDGLMEQIDRFSGNITFDESIAMLSSHIGFRLNPYECTTAEYFGHMKAAKRNSKKSIQA